jgi:hypothetical protein
VQEDQNIGFRALKSDLQGIPIEGRGITRTIGRF